MTDGTESTTGPSWERYRGYLRFLARSRLMHFPPGKFDASDVVHSPHDTRMGIFLVQAPNAARINQGGDWEL